MIIRGGENIAPAAVERVLNAQPGVREAAVIGVPHPDLGEEVCAFVVVDDGFDVESLTERIRADLASFAVPTVWKIGTEPLPTNQTGKVDKPALLALAIAESAGAE
jgi:acyl-CoA synthetase (AMP-forming)/AMP-acid ligase II